MAVYCTNVYDTLSAPSVQLCTMGDSPAIEEPACSVRLVRIEKEQFAGRFRPTTPIEHISTRTAIDFGDFLKSFSK